MKKTLLTILLAMTLGKGYAQQIAVGTDVAGAHSYLLCIAFSQCHCQ